MSRDDLARIDGVVAEVLAAGNFSVELENGRSISARICGRLRRQHIKVIQGDRVVVGVSPYDVSHGLIVSRGKTLA